MLPHRAIRRIFLSKPLSHGAIRRPPARWYQPMHPKTFFVAAAKTPLGTQVVQGVVLLGLVGFAADVVFRSEKVVVTGRRRYVAVPLLLEKEVGRVMAESFATSAKRVDSSDPDYVLVRRVADRGVRAAVELGAEYDWRFLLLEDKEVNAFCAPGGVVVVKTGMLKWLRANEKKLAEQGVSVEDALSVVISHELGHAVARHTCERFSWWPFLTLVTILRASSPLLVNLFKLGVALPISRTHETEADAIGVAIMARACFNLKAAPIFHQAFASQTQEVKEDSRMDKKGDGEGATSSPPPSPQPSKSPSSSDRIMSYSSTHPSSSQRAEACKKHVEEQQQVFQERCG